MSDWHWELHPDDLLDNLPPEALKEFRRIAHEITVRDSMIYLDGKDFTGGGPGLQYEATGLLLVTYLTDVRGERVVFLQVSWYGLSDLPAAERIPMADSKLVRDRIPEIIRADNLDPIIHIATPDEYGVALRDKLQEEVAEFLDAQAAGNAESSLKELADVLEVVHALASAIGFDPEKLEAARAAKAERNGAFAERYIWSGNR
jgi:predicted house-cleaning noncanonical NTP pyrophosphatase (MazG superfamily)